MRHVLYRGRPGLLIVAALIVTCVNLLAQDSSRDQKAKDTSEVLTTIVTITAVDGSEFSYTEQLTINNSISSTVTTSIAEGVWSGTNEIEFMVVNQTRIEGFEIKFHDLGFCSLVTVQTSSVPISGNSFTISYNIPTISSGSLSGTFAADGVSVGGTFTYTNFNCGAGTSGTWGAMPLPLINVTSPNGGENWQADSTQTITWTSTGTSGLVDIDLSTDGGASYSSIFSSIADDGSESWIVPNTPSNNCLIRITDYDGSPSDVSDAPFSITTEIDFLACLDGAQEVPPLMTDARGGGMFTLNAAQDTLSFDVRVCDLSGSITGAHFHNAPPGVPGGVVRAITTDFSGEAASGIWTSSDPEPLTPALVAELLAGNIYVNIHTAANPPGEIRGQLATGTPVDLSATLDGDQEVPPVTTPANGSGTFTLSGDGSQLYFDVTVNDLSGPITAAHFHHAAAGEPGGVVRGITSDFVGNHAMGSWTATDSEPLTPALVAELLAGKIYVNIHTAAYGGGEIRGQVLKAIPVEQTIAIQSGTLNMISLNVLPSALAAETVFDDLATLVVAQDDAGSFYIPSFAVNTIGEVDVTNGYQVFISGAGDDAVLNEGLPLVPDTLTQALSPTQLSMIGYPYQMAHPVVDVFASIASSVVVVQDDAGQFWIPAFGVNTIGAMQPGNGYQIFVDTPANFTYPAEAALPTPGRAKIATQPEPRHFKFVKTGLAYGIVLEASEMVLQVGDVVGVFDRGLCVGASVFVGDYQLVIAAWEGDETHGLAGFEAGADISVRVWKASDVEEIAAVASFGNLAESKFRGGPISVMTIASTEPSVLIPSRFSLHQNYPNPFNPETKIRFDIPAIGGRETVSVRLEVYNLAGQLVLVLLDEERSAGTHEILWDGRDEAGVPVPSGIYFYRFKAGDFKNAKRMLVLK